MKQGVLEIGIKHVSIVIRNWNQLYCTYPCKSLFQYPPALTKIKDLLTKSTKNILFKIMFLSIIHCKRELLLTTQQSIFFSISNLHYKFGTVLKTLKNEPFLTACRNSVYTWCGIYKSLRQVLSHPSHWSALEDQHRIIGSKFHLTNTWKSSYHYFAMSIFI